MENESENYIQRELAEFDEILGILNDTLKPTYSTNSQEVYNVQAVPILVYGIEIWDLRKKYIYIKQLTSIELKYFKRAAGTHFWATKAIKKFWKS